MILWQWNRGGAPGGTHSITVQPPHGIVACAGAVYY
jgi:hypothetical protein